MLRPALPGDAQAIRGLIRQAGLNPFGISWPRFIVAVDYKNQLLACGQIKSHRDGTAELASIAVVPAQRGRGLARAVIVHLLAENKDPLYLTCRASLQSFYIKFGFRTIGLHEMPTYFRLVYRLINGLHRLKIVPEALLVMKCEP